MALVQCKLCPSCLCYYLAWQPASPLLLSSVFLPPWLPVGMGWHLYLDTANSLLGDQNQPLIQGRVEVAFPLLGWDLTARVPLGKAEATQAHRVPPLQDPAQRPQCVSCVFSTPPSPHSPTKETCCHGIYCHVACSAWSPTGLSLGSWRQPLGIEGERKPEAMGAWPTISVPSTPRAPTPLHTSVPVSPLCTLHSNHTNICLFDWSFPCPVLPKGL